MENIVIKEFDGYDITTDTFALDLQRRAIKDCTGCWCCWKKTPGRCANKDLDDFYHAFINTRKAIFFTEVSMGFISGKLKTLFDRMIPLYLPYTSYKTGESMHVPRYDQYPHIEVYYQGNFNSDLEQDLYKEYLDRVFYQFHVKEINIQPFSAFGERGAAI